MKTTVNVFDFVDAFKQIRPDNFSYDGLTILFCYLEEWETSAGEEVDLDVIALCCDFSESDAYELIESYSIDLGDYAGVDTETDEDARDAVLAIVREFLEDEGALIGVTDNGTFVYSNL